jgi:hypothetical protein
VAEKDCCIRNLSKAEDEARALRKESESQERLGWKESDPSEEDFGN